MKTNAKQREHAKRSWVIQSARRPSAGPMVNKRQKRQGTRRERTIRATQEF